ncbi:hypothetical protein V8E36_000607 [Tilletia maclaganii]
MMMREKVSLLPILACFLLVLSSVRSVDALNIIISNDDGFGTANIRALYTALTVAGHSVIIAAPVENESGTDGARRPPRVLERDGDFGLARRGDPAAGNEYNPAAGPIDERIWYVNSFPASSVQYGLEVLSPRFFGGPPDLVLTGPNEGNNLGLSYLVSGTYGAARYAVQQGIPAIAFSTGNSTHRSYKDLAGSTDQAETYARIATELIQALVQGGRPYLPADTGLNVNMPPATLRDCGPEQQKLILTRLLGTIDPDPDTCTCGQSHTRKGCKLPTEYDVLKKSTAFNCPVTVSVFETSKWSPDASSTRQKVVLDRLSGVLNCL